MEEKMELKFKITMVQDETTILNEMIYYCRHLHQKNLLAAADGNISYRFDNERIAITPTGINKSMLTPQQLAWITLDNQIISGNPSSERLMHLEIYKKAPAAQAIVHAHPPTAIAWSLARPDMKELPTDALPEVIIAAGKIPIVPYARPGSLEMGTHLHPCLPQNRLMILARHGAVCWGESLQEASNGIERLEQVSTILKLADELGGAVPLPFRERQALYKLREEIGPRII